MSDVGIEPLMDVDIVMIATLQRIIPSVISKQHEQHVAERAWIGHYTAVGQYCDHFIRPVFRITLYSYCCERYGWGVGW